jgi:hypothetical protein
MREKVEILPTLNNLMDDDSRVAIDLFLLVFNIKEMCGVLDSFTSFKKYMKKEKLTNMFFLILDPRFKNLQILVSSFLS